MLKIELSGMKFFGFHGLHEEEKRVGGEFEVNVAVLYYPKSIPVKYIGETIDYTSIFSIIKPRMDTPTALLETLATEIASDIFASFLEAEDVIVEIKKLNPPITGFEGTVGVTYELKRHSRRH